MRQISLEINQSCSSPRVQIIPEFFTILYSVQVYKNIYVYTVQCTRIYSWISICFWIIKGTVRRILMGHFLEGFDCQVSNIIKSLRKINNAAVLDSRIGTCILISNGIDSVWNKYIWKLIAKYCRITQSLQSVHIKNVAYLQYTS